MSEHRPPPELEAIAGDQVQVRAARVKLTGEVDPGFRAQVMGYRWHRKWVVVLCGSHGYRFVNANRVAPVAHALGLKLAARPRR